jgi:hypothetical protein
MVHRPIKRFERQETFTILTTLGFKFLLFSNNIQAKQHK